MKTPAGQECRYYYEDFHRGRNKQECRLLKNAPGPKWKPSDCTNCPVPDILWANASKTMVLEGHIQPGILGIGRRVVVKAFCSKHEVEIPDPHVGCELCAAERLDLSIFPESD
jgi:hypothetical protein